MQKILKTIASCCLILNPIMISMGIYSLFNERWWLFPIAVVLVLINFKFYFYVYREEMAEFDAKLEEIEKTHTYVGSDEYGDVWYYENNETGEVIEF